MFGHQLTPQRKKSADNVAPFEHGSRLPLSINATHVARVYQPTESVSSAPLEVDWQRRLLAREIPVQFVSSPPEPVELSRPTAEELDWRSRESADKPGQA